ncbi:MAG: hypothetical protein JWM83_851 [Candidatus Angelobacter sp.]|nr:hypothetical protein [Candidatus Angelobacter sp.]
MTEPYVALTDYVLSLESLAFLFLLSPFRQVSKVRNWFFVFFSSVVVSSFVGGTVHGFFQAPSFVGERILWPTTLIVIGITSLSGIQIGKTLLWPGNRSALIETAIYASFCVYCGIVLFGSLSFLVAILGYLPSVFFLGCGFIKCYLRARQRHILAGVAGLGLILLASAIQQTKTLDGSPFFNRNVAYHLLQGIGLFMVFQAARTLE